MSEWVSTYKKIIISALIVVAIVVVGIALIYGLINGTVSNFFDNFLDIVSPIIIGFVIAYLSNPIVNFFEKYLFKWIHKFSIKRFISILLTLSLIIMFVGFLITMLIPSIIDTLESFWDTYVVNYKSSILSLAERINLIMDDFEFMDTMQRLDPEALLEWVQEKLPWLDKIANGDFSSIFPNTSDITSDANKETNSSNININELLTSENIWAAFTYAFSLGSSVFNIIKNTLLGIFISFYMLMSKERWKALIRRFLNVFLSPKNVRAVIRFGKLLDRSFGGFIEGQILDAIIVGITSYIIFSIFGIPIPHLIATIIAVTNVIPIFGPFIGGIPAAFIVLLTHPEKTLLFIILIVIIQQIDGNIICPHILGDKINISSLTTIIAIITMGGLFGILGMLIGVPVFAVAVNLIQNWTMNTLRRKGLETSLEHYYIGHIDEITENQDKSKNIFVRSFNALSDLIQKVLNFIKLIFKKHNNKEK